MYKYFAISLFIAAMFIMACNKTKAPILVSESRDLEIIDSIMDTQQEAWNNANLEGFMEAYWKSDSLMFIGKRGINNGWENTLTNYKNSYPDALTMGKLKFTNKHMDRLDSTNAFVIGQWELFRATDTLSGHYSLVWKKLNGHWTIVADHSS